MEKADDFDSHAPSPAFLEALGKRKRPLTEEEAAAVRGVEKEADGGESSKLVKEEQNNDPMSTSEDDEDDDDEDEGLVDGHTNSEEPEYIILNYGEPDDWFEPDDIYMTTGGVAVVPSRSTLFRKFIADTDAREDEEYVAKMGLAINHLCDVCEKRTMQMYYQLLTDPNKSGTLPNELRTNFDSIRGAKERDRNYRIVQDDWRMMECFFQFKLYGKLYTNLIVVRDKKTGERMEIIGPFSDYVRCPVYHNEDSDEQFVALDEHVKKEISHIGGKDLLKFTARQKVFDNVVATVIKNDKFENVGWEYMLACVQDNIYFKLEMELAEERRRAKRIVWEVHSQEDNLRKIYQNKEVLKSLQRINLIDSSIYHLREKFPSNDDGWASLSLEEQSHRAKWMEKIEAEHGQILQDVRKRNPTWRVMDYIKLKMEIAKEMGIWRVSADDYLQRVEREESCAAA